MKDWDHKDVWNKRGNGFLVEVYHYTQAVSESGCYDADLGHRWNVYAYIYPQHPRFSQFAGPSLFQDATGGLSLHGGCSFLQYPMYEGKVTCVKVGADYNHLHDTWFTRYATPEEAYEVFEDAQLLFDILQNQAAAAKTQSEVAA